jgi:hypothetical protein
VGDFSLSLEMTSLFEDKLSENKKSKYFLPKQQKTVRVNTFSIVFIATYGGS